MTKERDKQIAEAIKAGESFSSVANRFGMKIAAVGKISRSLGVHPVVEFSLDIMNEMYSRDREDNDWSRPQITKPKPYIEKLAALEVGEYLFLQGEPHSLGFTAHANKRLHPRRFTSKLEEDGVRIWRIR